MSRILIDNIGPITHVEFDINRFNVIIGKQCSGKSTIAKIVSFCQWLEKDIIAHQDKDYIDQTYLKRELLDYHKIGNYFDEGAHIQYDGKYIFFDYRNLELFSVIIKDGFGESLQGKVAYIPAERIIVTIPNISSIKMEDNYVRDYLFNWLSAHGKYTKERAIPLLDLNASYYFDEESKGDTILLSNNKTIGFDEASSGMQSVIPLLVYVNYITKWIFEHNEETSYDKYSVIQKAFLKEVLDNMYDVTVEEALRVPELQKRLMEILSLLSKARNNEHIRDLGFTTVTNLMERLERPHYANLIIEEPELNLFPQTQVRLIYDLLHNIDFSRDSVFMTTHSPYMLYALNNSMLAYNVFDSLEEEMEQVPCLKSRINPNWVSVWQTNEDGTMSNIKTSPIGLIGQHYFNEVMNDTLDEFHLMIDYIG